jgi:hypothetical protein
MVFKMRRSFRGVLGVRKKIFFTKEELKLLFLKRIPARIQTRWRGMSGVVVLWNRLPRRVRSALRPHLKQGPPPTSPDRLPGQDTVFEGLSSDSDSDSGLDTVFDSDSGSGSDSYFF